MVIEVKLVQFSKAPLPIVVTELGIVTEVKPLQPEKALTPIEVTELPMVTEVKPVHRKKQPSAIPVHPLISTIDVPFGIIPLYSYATIPAYTIPSG